MQTQAWDVYVFKVKGICLWVLQAAEPLPAPEGFCFQEMASRMCCKQVVSVRKCESAEALTFNRASLRLEAFSRSVAKLVAVCELKATARADNSSTSCFRTSSAAAFLAFLPVN